MSASLQIKRIYLISATTIRL